MSRTAIISVDGHVKASRAGYRDYVEQQYLDDFDRWVKAADDAGLPDAGKPQPGVRRRHAVGLGQAPTRARKRRGRRRGPVSQRSAVPDESAGGLRPYAEPRTGCRRTPDLQPVVPRTFVARLPGRRAGQAVIVLRRHRQAVNGGPLGQGERPRRDHDAAAEPGRHLLLRPGARPGLASHPGRGPPISQHGGSGAPAYSPPGFASIITLAMEHSFFSGRSLSQLMVGGVFDRFPDLQVAFVETEAYWMGPMIKRLERFVGFGSDWMGFARSMNRDATMSRRPRSTGPRTATPASPRSLRRWSRSTISPATTTVPTQSSSPSPTSSSLPTKRCSASTTPTSNRSSPPSRPPSADFAHQPRHHRRGGAQDPLRQPAAGDLRLRSRRAPTPCRTGRLRTTTSAQRRPPHSAPCKADGRRRPGAPRHRHDDPVLHGRPGASATAGPVGRWHQVLRHAVGDATLKMLCVEPPPPGGRRHRRRDRVSARDPDRFRPGRRAHTRRMRVWARSSGTRSRPARCRSRWRSCRIPTATGSRSSASRHADRSRSASPSATSIGPWSSSRSPSSWRRTRR